MAPKRLRQRIADEPARSLPERWRRLSWVVNLEGLCRQRATR